MSTKDGQSAEIDAGRRTEREQVGRAFVHVHDYLDGDGFTYCQECTEATGDYVLIADCPDRQPPRVTPPAERDANA